MNTKEILKNQTPHRWVKSLAAINPIKQSLVASIAALLAVSATQSAHALPIKNGGFESGGLGGWTTTIVFDGGITSAEAYAGSYSLKLEAVDIVYQDVTTLKRFETLKFHAKAEDPITVSTAYAFVSYYDGTSSEIMFGGACLTSGDWTAFELDLDSTKRISRVTFAVGESTPIYLDNVALTGP